MNIKWLNLSLNRHKKSINCNHMSNKHLSKFFSRSVVKELSIILLFFSFSIAIRLISLKHGFPLLTHPDESVIVDLVFKMTSARTLNPGNFNRPNQILYTVNFFYLNILSYIRFGENMGLAFPKHYLSFYAYARFLIAIIGSLIPIVVYKIGNEFRPKFGWLAALVFALYPSYLMHSVFVTPDIPITLFTLLVMYFTIRYLNRQEEKSIYIAVVFAAINTAEKYPGLISLMIVFSGIILNTLDESQLDLKKALVPIFIKTLKITGVFIGTLFIVAPFLFIEYEAVIEALIRESRTTHLGADNLGWGGNLLFYIRSFYSWTNVLSILFIGIGIYAFIKWKKKSHFILLYGVFYWILLSALSLHWERWALPMYITPLFFIAIGMCFLLVKTKEKTKTQWFSIFTIVIFFILQFVATLHTSIRMSFVDTRVVALQFSREKGISPENSLFEGYTPFMSQHPITIFNEYAEVSSEIEYVILSSSMFGRFYREPDRYNQEILIYEKIRDNHLLGSFSPEPLAITYFDKIEDITLFFRHGFQIPGSLRLIGPTIEIYKLQN